MANYYATARSNYFRVKDLQAFKDAMPGGIGIWEEDDLIAVYDDGGDSCGWPSFDYGSEEIFWLPELVAQHLLDGEVAVFMESGSEKLRYVIGIATAINSKGEHRTVSLHDIYELAEELGEHVSKAEY